MSAHVCACMSTRASAQSPAGLTLVRRYGALPPQHSSYAGSGMECVRRWGPLPASEVDGLDGGPPSHCTGPTPRLPSQPRSRSLNQRSDVTATRHHPLHKIAVSQSTPITPKITYADEQGLGGPWDVGVQLQVVLWPDLGALSRWAWGLGRGPRTVTPVATHLGIQSINICVICECAIALNKARVQARRGVC